MNILGLGRKYKYAIGSMLKYNGNDEKFQKMYDGRKLTVKDRKHEDGKDWYGCQIGKSTKLTWFSESKVCKCNAKGMSGLVGTPPTDAGLGALAKGFSIQDVDRRANAIRRASGVKSKKTVVQTTYNVSIREAKKRAFAEMRK